MGIWWRKKQNKTKACSNSWAAEPLNVFDTFNQSSGRRCLAKTPALGSRLRGNFLFTAQASSKNGKAAQSWVFFLAF